MKITVQRDALLSALQLVSAAVPSSAQVPALKNVKATAEGESLLLVGYDPTLGVGVRHTIAGVAVARAGSCILPKDKLIQILRESGQPEVRLDAGAQGIDCQAGGKYQLQSWPAEDYPDLPEVESAPTHELSAGTLRQLVKRATFAADKKDTTAKFSLQGVLWEVQKDLVRIVATDTKRLAVCEGPAKLLGEAPDERTAHLVSLKALSILERSLGGDAEPVTVTLRNNDAQFRCGATTVYAALLQGKFPPYRDIIKKTRAAATQKITLPAAAFMGRVRQAAIMTDAESMRVDMAFEPGKVTMSAEGTNTGKSEVVLELPDHDGPRTAVSFDPHYLTEFLKSRDEAAVELEMADGTKAVLFTVGDQPAYLVMPLTG